MIRASGDFYEAEILDYTRGLDAFDGTVVDAGAHIGNHSVYWLAFCAPRRLVAVEPLPSSFDVLRRNLAPFRDTRAYLAALSDEAGKVMLAPDDANRGRTHIDPAGTVPARAVRLDDLGLGRVSLLKLDVEGWQDHALRGAAATIAADRPFLLVEDGEGLVEPTLADLGIARYTRLAEFPGANAIWAP